MRRFLIVFAAVANLVLVDAVTKEIAAARLKGCAAVSVIPGCFSLAYVENRGCAWGMLQGQDWPLAVFAVVALAVIVWRRRDIFAVPEGSPRSAAVLGAVAEPLVLAGIIGNLVDRVFRGYVVDMLDFHWGASHFPCFNFADTCICVGAGMVVLSSLLTPSRAEGKESGE